MRGGGQGYSGPCKGLLNPPGQMAILGFELGAPKRAPTPEVPERASKMTRAPLLNSPFLLGFDDIERALERVTKSASDGYPPYNIERLPGGGGQPERLRITLAVAGFAESQLEITLEENQIIVKGRQSDERPRQFIHRGIAARQFQRSFLLAEGLQVLGAELRHGLLAIDLVRPQPARVVKKINIAVGD